MSTWKGNLYILTLSCSLNNQESLFSKETYPTLGYWVNSLCMKWCTNQCFENNDLELSKLNKKTFFDCLPYWVGLLLESHAVEMLKSAYWTKSSRCFFFEEITCLKTVTIVAVFIYCCYSVHKSMKNSSTKLCTFWSSVISHFFFKETACSNNRCQRFWGVGGGNLNHLLYKSVPHSQFLL